jgi:hypothetical protein
MPVYLQIALAAETRLADFENVVNHEGRED